MASGKTQGREAVVATTRRHQSKSKALDPGLRRDDESGAFAGMTIPERSPGWREWGFAEMTKWESRDGEAEGLRQRDKTS
jgi:hypothetical protein